MKKRVILLAIVVALVISLVPISALAHREIGDFDFSLVNTGYQLGDTSSSCYRYHTIYYGISNPDSTTSSMQNLYVITRYNVNVTNARWSTTQRREHTYNMSTIGDGFKLGARQDTTDPNDVVRTIGTWSPDDAH